MPIYDFCCLDCNHLFDALASHDESGLYEKVKCPLCNRHDKKKKVPSRINFKFSNPVGSDRWNSDSQGHDYRFKHNLPNVLAQREAAERASHMGSSSEIYGNQAESDLNNDAAWGEVK